MNLSVIVLAYNEEVNLPACLESLKRLDCEVFVVDSGSTDRTVEIAQKWGATVVEHPFENYATQRNWALRSLPLKGRWVLNLDADERLTPELVVEINQLLLDPPPGVAGFMLRKRTFFMGRWIKHGGHYPAYHLRLFVKQCGHCENRLYDQHFIVHGEARRLKNDYIDILTSDLTAWTVRHARWAELEAQEIVAKAQAEGLVRSRFFGTPIERRRWLRNDVYSHAPLFIRALLYWFYRYVIRLGFLDGKEGLIFHFLQGAWFRFLVDAQVRELLKEQTASFSGTPPVSHSILAGSRPAGRFKPF